MAALLLNYAREFVAVADFCEKSGKGRLHKGYMLASKSDVEELLDHNKYETAANKLKKWKALHWIDAEDKRVTRRVYDVSIKQYIPYIKLDMGVYKALEGLM